MSTAFLLPGLSLQERQALTIQVLTILNRCESAQASMRELLEAIKEATGFEAVALRLRQDEDYPYFLSLGFPSRFVEAESSLCERTGNGELRYGSDGLPQLSCMCGLVIRGQTPEELPFFTPGGSFWTNSTSRQLQSGASASRHFERSFRMRCPDAGYESMALIPLTSGQERIGLLQLNDRRPDRLSLDTVQFFEGLGQSIGIAFERMMRERGLQRTNETLERLVAEKTSDLQVALQEKEALLQEVHHRVKNNLQVVDGLLGLTMNRAQQEETLAVCRNIRSQVLGMSLVHHQLYGTSRLHEIRFDIYLQRLWQELSRIFATSHIQPSFELQEITLPLQLAHPCSLAVNEALSNVLKHAFPQQQTGWVLVRMRLEKGELQLTIADNGVGLPGNIEGSAQSSLGLKLLKSIVQGQLRGRLAIGNRDGTTVHIAIPYTADRESHAG